MYCPRCNVSLLMTETQGIEMNYCPQCSGIWLDRNRLDRIMGASVQPKVYTGYNPHNHQHDDLDLIRRGYYKHSVKDWFG